MSEEVKKEEAKVLTFTEEELNKEYVKRSEFDKMMREYQKVIDAFNTLMGEYNQLHLKILLNVDKE